MIDNKELKTKKLPELKKIAKDNNIKLPAAIKKGDLIKLIEKELGKKEKKPEVKEAKEQKTEQAVTPKKIDISKIPDIPAVYGKDKLIFMIKDPNWGFVYWEFSENNIKTHNIYNDYIEKVLRVYDISDGRSSDNPNYFVDVRINLAANNWYLDFLAPNKTYIIELGYFKDSGFVTVLRSNVASTPRDAVSDQIDQEWMLTDEQFRIILMASGIDKIGSSDFRSSFTRKI